MSYFRIFFVSELRMIFFRLFFFVLLLQEIFLSENITIKTHDSSFYAWITQQFKQKEFEDFSLFSDNFLQKISLQGFNVQEDIFLRVADSVLLPEQDFKTFLYQKEIHIKTKELYLIQASFLKKPSAVNLDHRIFLLFFPLSENQSPQNRVLSTLSPDSFESVNLQNNEFLFDILDNWKNFNKNNNSVLLLVYDFSLLSNIYQDLFFTDLLKLGDDLPENLSGNVLLLDYKLIEAIFLQKRISVKGLFKKTPVVKINIPIEFKSQKLSDTTYYNMLEYLPKAVKMQ